MKKIILLITTLFLSFFLLFDTVKAEEKKVYWNVGGTTEDAGLKQVLISNGFASDEIENITKIVFYDNSKSNTSIDYDNIYEFDLSKEQDKSVIVATKGTEIYIQFNGTLYFNAESNYMFYNFSNITSIEGLEYIDTSEVTMMNYMFSNCKKLQTLDLSNFNTSNVISMSSMFRNCSSLEYLDVSTFDTSKVKNVTYLFRACSSLKKLDLSNWDLSAVTSGPYMITDTNLYEIKTPKSFSTNIALGLTSEYIDEQGKVYSSSLQTPNITLKLVKKITYYNLSKSKKIAYDAEYYGELLVPTKTGYSFEGWYKDKYFRDEEVTSETKFEGEDVVLYPKYYSPSQIVYWDAMIGYSSLTQYPLMKYLISEGINSEIIQQVDKIEFNDIKRTNNKITEFEEEVDISKNNDYTVIAGIKNNILYIQYEGTLSLNSSSRYLFASFVNVESINGFEYIDTSSVTDITGLFYDMQKLKSIDLSNFNTSKVTGMAEMFYNCNSIEKLDLSNLKTDKVTRMTRMFSGCSKLSNLDLSNFNTSNVTAMVEMFSGCSNLKSLNLSNFDTSNVVNMANMFYNCTSLETIDLSSFNTSKVEKMDYMFYNCSKLVRLDLSHFDTTELYNIKDMFYNCSSLIYLNMSTFVVPNSINYYGFFLYGCENLQIFVVPKSLNTIGIGEFYDSSYKVYTELSSNLKQGTTLYKKYILRFDVLEEDVKKDILYGMPYGNLPTLSHFEEYHFLGWYKDQNYEIPVDSNTLYEDTTDITLYAKLEPKKAEFLEGNTVSFKDNLSLNFLVELSSGNLDGAYVIFKYLHYGEDVEIKVPVNENDKHGDYYRFRCELTASEMMIPVTAELYLKDSTEPISTWTRSIRDYIIAGLNSESSSEAEKKLFRATLNYGGYTQKRFNYNGEPYAYTDYMDDLSNISISTAANFVRPEGFIEGIKYVGSSVFFRNAPYVRYYFEIEENEDINDYTFKIGDKVIVPTQKDNRYYIESTPELAYELDNIQQIFVTKSETNVFDFEYSVINWAKIAVDNTTNIDESNMAKAMYAYYLASKEFVESNV